MTPFITFVAVQAAAVPVAPPVYAPPAPPPPTIRYLSVPPAPPPPPRPTLARPTRFLNQWSIIRSKDYPKAALRVEASGRTRYRIEVSRKGRVTDCTILIGSGNADLDARACERLRKRARMAPATDAAGKPTTGTYEGNVIWRIPG